MTTIYTNPPAKVTNNQLDANFSNISNEKLAQTSSTGAIKLPVANDTNYPSVPVGGLRFNSTTTNFEGKYNNVWSTVGARGAVGNLAVVLSGFTGSKGLDNIGDVGFTGSRGYRGSVGLVGDTGLRGLRGPTGAMGTQGDPGENGPTGPPGGAGYYGSRGYTGSISKTIIKSTFGINTEGFSINTLNYKPGFGNTNTGVMFSNTGNIYISKYSSTEHLYDAALKINAASPSVDTTLDTIIFSYAGADTCRTSVAYATVENEYQFAMIPVGSKTLVLNTGSDYRLKENLMLAKNEVEKLDKIKLYNFNFKNNPSNQFSFVAHEIQEFVPEMVTHNKDEIDDNGKPIYQVIANYTIIPFLISSLNELNNEINLISNSILGKIND